MTTETKTVATHQTFASAVGRVYDAFLDAPTAAKFLFRTPAGEMVRQEVDARVGGFYAFTERRGGEDVLHTGEYLELERPRRIVFTFSVPKYSSAVSTVAIAIVPQGAGCEVTLTNSGVPAEWAEPTGAGWEMILAKAAALIECDPTHRDEAAMDGAPGIYSAET
jgi:uncharacterized protein YndB with AHSA1/START domain